jgi:hypothetical protein
MSSESQHPDTITEAGAAGGPVSGTAAAERRAEERADHGEDRRRQRELDDGELGGEA